MLDGDQDFAYIHCVCDEPKCFCVKRTRIPSKGKVAKQVAGKKDYVLPCDECKRGKHTYDPVDAGYAVVDDIMGFTKDKMESSDAVLLVMQRNWDGRQTLEMGLAMLLGKTIILCLVGDAKASDKVLAAADSVIHVDKFNERDIQRAASVAYRGLGKGKPN